MGRGTDCYWINNAVKFLKSPVYLLSGHRVQLITNRIPKLDESATMPSKRLLQDGRESPTVRLEEK